MWILELTTEIHGRRAVTGKCEPRRRRPIHDECLLEFILNGWLDHQVTSIITMFFSFGGGPIGGVCTSRLAADLAAVRVAANSLSLSVSPSPLSCNAFLMQHSSAGSEHGDAGRNNKSYDHERTLPTSPIHGWYVEKTTTEGDTQLFYANTTSRNSILSSEVRSLSSQWEVES